MINKEIQAIVLAAGKSRRFNTGTSKQLASICGQAMILYPLRMLKSLEIHTTVVLGCEAESIKKEIQKNISDISFSNQPDQLGTGNAIACSKDAWNKDTILILNGDTPLITKKIIENFYKNHVANDATISFLSAHVIDPTGYGRIINQNKHVHIVEDKQCTKEQKDIHLINAGVYLIKRRFLDDALKTLKKTGSEYYITDLVKRASEQNKKIEVVSVPYDNVRGVNTLEDLWAVEQIKRSELIKYWMSEGVRFDLAQCIHIDWSVSIGAGTFIGSGVHVLRDTQIGKNCTISAFSILENMKIEDDVKIYSHSVLQDSTVGSRAHVGPFARLRNNVVVSEDASVGNFVEVKNSSLGAKTKVKHLSYIGDASVGDNVNIGAGVITCNHDGAKKHKTTIKDNAFVGSNSTLVAPITIGEGAYSAAGSTLTKDVEKNDLAIARSRQENKAGYAQKLRDKKSKTITTKTSVSSEENKKIFAACKLAYSPKEAL